MGQKGMIMRNNKLRLHNMATAPWRGRGKGLETAPKESSSFSVQNPAEDYSASPFVAPRVRLGSKMLVEMLDPRIKQLSCTSQHYCFVFFTSHSNPASMAPGSLYVAGAAAGNCGWTGARGGAA